MNSTQVLLWVAFFYGGAALLGYGVGNYHAALGGGMVLHACIIAFNIGR